MSGIKSRHTLGPDGGAKLYPLDLGLSPSAAPLAEATRRLAGYAYNYPGLRRFAAGP
jgi:hypothetical protein